MATIQCDPETRDTVQALKEDFGFDSAGDFLDAAMEFLEDNADAFEESIGDDEDEDEVEE